MSDLTGQDEARRALVDRHLAIAESVRAVVSRRRQELDLSLQQVADRSGLTKAHVWEVEQGRSRNVCISSIVGLASGLGVSEGELLGLTALRAPSLDRGAEEMEDRLDRYEDALHDIQRWSEAYPLSVFPEPDLKKARALLEAGGMTLDSISAYCMRHVVEGVGKIARRALPVPADLNEGNTDAPR